MNRSLVLAALVFLILGLGFGSVFFPQTVTKTSTQTSIQTEVTTLTIATNSSMSVVTATVIGVEVYPVIATCTSVNGEVSVSFSTAMGGSTILTTVYPPNLPQQYEVTLVTASNVGSASFQTQPSSPDVCP